MRLFILQMVVLALGLVGALFAGKAWWERRQRRRFGPPRGICGCGYCKRLRGET